MCIESDGSSSFVINKPGSPVIDVTLELNDQVVTVLLSGQVNSSVTIHLEFQEEAFSPDWLEWSLSLLLQLLDLILLNVVGNSWMVGLSHVGSDCYYHNLEFLLRGLSASLPVEC